MRTTIAFLLLVCPTTAFAQGSLPTAGEATGAVDDDAATTTRATTEYDFEKGDDVTGSRNKPLGEQVRGEMRPKTSSLIDVRRDFVDELMTSVEDI